MAVADKSLGELFADLAADVKHLFKAEARLAKTELSQKAAVVGKDVGLIASGGAVLYAGFLVVLAGIVLMLAQLTDMPLWGSALLVGVVVLVAGGGLIASGAAALKRQSLVPEQTVATLKEDAKWAKEQVTPA